LANSKAIVDLPDPEDSIYRSYNSFKPPFGGTTIRYWEVGGRAVIGESSVRLTSGPKETGWIRCLRRLKGGNFELRMSFFAGSTSTVGSDGIALWITKQKNLKPGPIFGMQNEWDGLLLAFDSGFHDGKTAKDNPRIYAVVNNGSVYGGDWRSTSSGSCTAAIRQVGPKPDVFTFVVTLQDGELKVQYDTPTDKLEYIHCLNFPLSLNSEDGYVITVSASTGQNLPDIHEIHQFLTWTENENIKKKKQEEKANSKDTSDDTKTTETNEEIVDSKKEKDQKKKKNNKDTDNDKEDTKEDTDEDSKEDTNDKKEKRGVKEKKSDKRKKSKSDDDEEKDDTESKSDKRKKGKKR